MTPSLRWLSHLVALLCIVLTLTGCGGQSSPAPVLDSITLSPSTLTLDLDATQTFNAVLKDNTGKVMTGQTVVWTSSDASVVKIDPSSGKITALKAGNVVIKATSGNKSGQASVQVIPQPASLELSSTTLALQTGQKTTLQVTVKDRHQNIMAGQKAYWKSSNPSVLSINGVSGEATAVQAGTAEVTVQVGTLSTKLLVTVTQQKPQVHSITIDPSGLKLWPGESHLLKAVLKDAQQQTIAGEVTWSSSGPQVTIKPTGEVTAVSAGTAQITASVDSVQNSITVTVEQAARVNILPTDDLLIRGTSQQFRVQVFNAANQEVVPPVVTWSSSAPDVLAVNGDGLASALKAGTVILKVNVYGTESTVSVKVVEPVASVGVTPAQVVMELGAELQMQAELRDAQGQVVDRPVTWTTLSPDLFMVSAAGRITALKAGQGTLKVGVPEKSIEVSVNIVEKIQAVSLQPTFRSLYAGTQYQMEVVLKDRDGKTITGLPVTWSSKNPAVLKVNAQGLIEALTAGAATLQIQAGTTTQSFDFQVQNAPTIKAATLAAGGFHSCSLKDGQAYCWGHNVNGVVGQASEAAFWTPVPVQKAPAFKSIYAGEYHSCALTPENQAFCWGVNLSGQLGFPNDTQFIEWFPKAARGDARYLQLSLGASHTCGVSDRYEVSCWGNNEYSKLGTIETTETSQSQLGNLMVQQVSAGGDHTCALNIDQQVYCWGANYAGQLGVGQVEDTGQPIPRKVVSDLSFKQVSAGGRHTCALTLDGEAYCWGFNGFGQLGLGSTISQSTPMQVKTTLRFGSIEAKSDYTCAVATTGQMLCWGQNEFGKLGNGSWADEKPQPNPTPVSGNLTFTEVSAGKYHVCGQGTNVYCWGNNDSQLGTGPQPFQPVKVSSSLTFESIDAGNYSSCGLSAGQLLCWGSLMRAIAQNPSETGFSPVMVGSSYKQVASGDWFVCGLDTTLVTRCWNLYGFTGEDRSVPTVFSTGLDFSQLVAGSGHACGLLASGEVYCWGHNNKGQLGRPVTSLEDRSGTATQIATPLRFIQLTASDDFTCGLSSEQKVYCWGMNGRGQFGGSSLFPLNTPTPVNISPLKFISAGAIHVCGLTMEGKAYCWGANDRGQLGDGTTNNSSTPVAVTGNLTFTHLASGTQHTCGITTAGTTYCWGDNYAGQLGHVKASNTPQPTQMTTPLVFQRLTAGWGHTCGITTAGSTYCWGQANYGQLGDEGLNSLIPKPVVFQ